MPAPRCSPRCLRRARQEIDERGAAHRRAAHTQTCTLRCLPALLPHSQRVLLNKQAPPPKPAGRRTGIPREQWSLTALLVSNPKAVRMGGGGRGQRARAPRRRAARAWGMFGRRVCCIRALASGGWERTQGGHRRLAPPPSLPEVDGGGGVTCSSFSPPLRCPAAPHRHQFFWARPLCGTPTTAWAGLPHVRRATSVAARGPPPLPPLLLPRKPPQQHTAWKVVRPHLIIVVGGTNTHPALAPLPRALLRHPARAHRRLVVVRHHVGL